MSACRRSGNRCRPRPRSSSVRSRPGSARCIGGRSNIRSRQRIRRLSTANRVGRATAAISRRKAAICATISSARSICARCRTGSSGRRCGWCRVSPAPMPSAATSSSIRSRRIRPNRSPMASRSPTSSRRCRPTMPAAARIMSSATARTMSCGPPAASRISRRSARSSSPPAATRRCGSRIWPRCRSGVNCGPAAPASTGTRSCSVRR